MTLIGILFFKLAYIHAFIHAFLFQNHVGNKLQLPQYLRIFLFFILFSPKTAPCPMSPSELHIHHFKLFPYRLSEKKETIIRSRRRIPKCISIKNFHECCCSYPEQFLLNHVRKYQYQPSTHIASPTDSNSWRFSKTNQFSFLQILRQHKPIPCFSKWIYLSRNCFSTHKN